MFGDPLENPFGWEQVTLKDISKGKLSYGSGASATTYDGKTRYVRITDITDSGELNDDIKSPSIYEAIHALNEGDILFARSGATVGKTYCHNEKYGKCIYAGYLIRLIPDKEKVLPEYVFHYTKTDYYNNFVAINKRTVAQPNINAKQYGDLVICVPPLEIQNRFVELIHQTDKSKFVCYSNFKSQFIEMFGLPIDNVKCFKKGTIREVVSEVKYGTSKPATIGGKYPYLRMNNITYEGQLDLTDLKFIDIPDKEIEKCVVRKGDVLFNRTNSKELVGKTCVFNIDTPMVIAGYIIRVKVNEKVIPEYLSTFLNLKYSKNILFEMCKAAIGQANINAQELQDIEIIIPPMSLQLKFLDLLHQTDKSKLSEHVTYNSLGDMLVNLNLFRR